MSESVHVPETHLHLITSTHDLHPDQEEQQQKSQADGKKGQVTISGGGSDGVQIGSNRPTLRKQLIYTSLLSAAAEKKSLLKYYPILLSSSSPSPLSLSLSIARCVHSIDMLSFFERSWKEWRSHVQSGTADEYMGNNLSSRKEADLSVFIPGQTAPHDRPLLSRPGNTIHSQICYYALDRMTPIQAHTLFDLASDLRVVEKAVEIVKEYQSLSPSVPSPVLYALTTQPGHHASYQTYGGYCFINNAAVAASLLQSTACYDKVAVLDVDYHAGNGTMSIFYNNPTVLTVSLHIHPDLDYPYNQGYADQTGEGEGLGKTLNIPLLAGTNWSEYRVALESALKTIRTHGTKALVVSLGVDTVRGDPEVSPLGGFTLDANDYKLMGQLIRAEGYPTIFIQEGGYLLSKVGEVVRNVVMD